MNELGKIKGNFDLAINLAAQAGIRLGQKDKHLYIDSNIKGFKSFCNFCKNNNISNAIYASSSSVYSDNNKIFNEKNTKLKPRSFYGETKLFNEQYAERFSIDNDIKMIGLRFFTVYGPDGRPDMAYYSFSKSLQNDKLITLYNQGKMKRDMTYIDDIIDGIALSIKYLDKSGQKINNEIFNLGNNYPIETAYLLETLENKFNKKSILKNLESINEISCTHADLTKSSSILGYNPKVKFEIGIEKFFIWFKEYEKFQKNYPKH